LAIPNRNPSYESPEAAIRRLAPKVALLAIGVIALLTFGFGSFYSVEGGHVGIVTRFGAVVDVQGPGAHGKLPLIDSVTEINTRTQTIEWARTDKGDSRMASYSKDQQPAEIGVKVSFSVKTDEKSVRDLFQQYRDANGYANAVIVPRALQGVKTVFGRFNAVGVIQDRDNFNKQVLDEVTSLIGNAGPIVVEQVNVQDIDFDDSYEAAVKARMEAEVEVTKIAQNLERERKQAEILVVQAKASAESVRLAGEAEADAIRARSNALRDSPKLVELVIAEKWNGVLPTTMVPNTAVPFIGVK
jgi:regulator of protease activity HflC (stomatin/prohibitin superfamily)